MTNYCIICPSCSSEFFSYEKYINHIFKEHSDQPSLRMQVKIIKKNEKNNINNFSQNID